MYVSTPEGKLQMKDLSLDNKVYSF